GGLVPGAGTLVAPCAVRGLPRRAVSLPDDISSVRALLLGARGMLGRALASSGPPNVELIAVSHEHLDITRSDAVASTLNTVRPHIVINASGFTAVDRAETERAEAFAVNATAVAELGSACKRH